MALKKEIREALKVAKKLEEHEPLPREKVLEVYKEGIKEAEDLRRLLKPEWFLGRAKKPPLQRKRAKKSSRKKR